MTREFFRFPHTPHLAWLAAGKPREDKVLSEEERRTFLDRHVIIEEKVDGTNLGISLDSDGRLRVQRRGALLRREDQAHLGPFWGWLAAHEASLLTCVGAERILFGEWCFAVHSVRYAQLPDWFLAFDIYDRTARRFWSAERRNALLNEFGFARVPLIATGRFELRELQGFLECTSQLGSPHPEGLYVRRDEGAWTAGRAKLVRPEFAESIGEHWTHRVLTANRIASSRRPSPLGGGLGGHTPR